MRFTGLALILLAVTPSNGAGDELFNRSVKPILLRHCAKCHGPKKQESELRLDSGQALLTGGNNGRAVVPGRPKSSLLLQVILGTAQDVPQMPPKGAGRRLSKQEVAIIRRWIMAGAKVPANEKTAAGTRRRSDHWSFQPVRRPHLPRVSKRTRVTNPIDYFVLAQLERRGLQGSPPATRTTLIRRLYLDLLGLPPSVKAVQQFLLDQRPGAVERLVDRLLASPRYGERWGRHWLDQARYADSDGYTNDVARVMWRYRDWVIKALNRDLPFDRFTIEQFAGDLLPKPTIQQVIATGFHRNTQRNREGGSNFEQYRTEAVVDRVATTGVVFLGLTLGCARCHDHKYDPISQREFYQIFAFLNDQEEPKITVPIRAPSKEYLQAAAQLEKIKTQARDKSRSVQARKKLTQQAKKLAERVGQLKRQNDTTTLVMRELKKPRMTSILIRGDFLRPGKTVQPNVPEVLPPIRSPRKRYNRLDLARWIVSANNPLTPRVTVNRVWQQFFGVGIVETENDFGLQGTNPSHPQLLDWLASEFVRQNWSLKSLHRLILTSATYRQSSRHREDLQRVDPLNRLLGRQNRLRLEGEVVRDTSLAVSGLLSTRMLGPSVFPPQPAGVMKMTRNPNRKWRVSQGENRFRRAMYTYFWRSTPYPFLKLFNSPESNTTCTRRDRSNTPLQALTLLNDEVFIEAAQGLALHVLKNAPSSHPREQLRFAFQSCLSRQPNTRELSALFELLQAELKDTTNTKVHLYPATRGAVVRPQSLLAWTTIARVLLNTDEFITRE